MAPLRFTMQLLIDICYKYATRFCLSFNFKKTKTIVFGKTNRNPIPLRINECSIDYVDEWDYLGAKVKPVDCKTGWIYFSAIPSKFYASSNSILHTSMNLNKPMLLHLLYTNCVTTITFAAEVNQWHTPKKCESQ